MTRGWRRSTTDPERPMTVPALIDEPRAPRIASDLDENLCVEAAAGTGKTTVLVARVVEPARRAAT